MYESSKLNAKQMHTMCLRKRKFNSEKAARKFADKKEKEYNCKNKVYYCPLCGGWHITVVKDK